MGEWGQLWGQQASRGRQRQQGSTRRLARRCRRSVGRVVIRCITAGMICRVHRRTCSFGKGQFWHGANAVARLPAIARMPTLQARLARPSVQKQPRPAARSRRPGANAALPSPPCTVGCRARAHMQRVCYA